MTSLFRKGVVIAAGLASAIATTTYVAGQQQAAAPPAPKQPALAPWGSGPIRVMLVTPGGAGVRGHQFAPRGEFFDMWDALGTDISWSAIENPGAPVLLSPKYSDLFDVYVFYDGVSRRQNMPTAIPGWPVRPVPKGAMIMPDGKQYHQPPPEYLKEELPKLMRAGNKGFVFLHHANASWVQLWPEYLEAVGSACEFGEPVTVRGFLHPRLGAHQNTPQKFTIVDKNHPVTKGVSDFEFTDEAYTCHFFEDSVHPLVRTSWNNPDAAKQLNEKVPFSNLAAYVKVAENSPVVYIQMGHGAESWAHPAYRQLVLNAIKWVASPEAQAWAKANSKKIFK